MKFKKATETQEKIKKAYSKLLEREKFKQSADSIADFKRFNNIAVYLMKFNVKGNFKYISNLVNDGEKPCCWSIRICFINRSWMIQIAPHPKIDKSKLGINLKNFLEDLNIDHKIRGYLHVGTVENISDKEAVEDIVNTLIDEFKNKFIEGLEDEEIDEKYTIDSSEIEYKIPSRFKEQFTQESFLKYLKMIKSLNDNIDKIPKKHQKRIKEIFFNLKNDHYISKENRNWINDVIKKYLSEKERIKIAMSFLSRKLEEKQF